MKLQWDKVGEHFYETGVDQGVLYVQKNDGTYNKGVNWDGLTSVDESPEGAEANDVYADNIKYLTMISAEKFKATINAYQSPEEFDACDGAASLGTGVTVSGQSRRAFGFSYRTRLGNDIEGDDYGEIVHLVYGLKASPSQRTRSTVNDSPEATELSWEVNSTPIATKAVDPDTGKQLKPVSHLMINSKKTDPTKYQQLLDLIYGTDDGEDVYTEVQDPTPDTYSEPITPTGEENPKALGWYERTGTVGDYTYTLSDDTEVNNEKTYVTKTAGDNPHDLGWYEKTGETTYTVSADTSVNVSKTYYVKSSTGTDATLPTPDQVYAILNSNG